MSNLNAAGANNLKIRNVFHVQYLQMPSSGPVHLIVNKTQYVGKYPTLANAQEALEGILMRLGSKNPTTRRGQITTVTTDLTFTGDVTSNAANWTDITHVATLDTNTNIRTDVYNTSEVQITGINTPISLRVFFSNTSTANQLWAIVSATSTSANITVAPSDSTGYRRLRNSETLTVPPGYYVRFKATSNAGTIINQSTTISVRNESGSIDLDTFVLANTYSEIGGV